MRTLRAIALLALGFWTGMVAAAAVVKRAVPSRGDEESDEVALVGVFSAVSLKSRAKAFRGGFMFSWHGGISADLRGAQIAPGGAHLSVHSLFGGIAIRVPPGWRVESRVKALAGGVAVGVPEPGNPDAPTLTLDGFVAFGGVAVGVKPDAAPAPPGEG